MKQLVINADCVSPSGRKGGGDITVNRPIGRWELVDAIGDLLDCEGLVDAMEMGATVTLTMNEIEAPN